MVTDAIALVTEKLVALILVIAALTPRIVEDALEPIVVPVIVVISAEVLEILVI